MKWTKLGLIVRPGNPAWMVTHAQNPFPERIKDDLFRIHFAGRDAENRARGGHVTISINNPVEILSVTEKPTLDIGDLGCFDDCGVMPSCIVQNEGAHYMYYTGWTQTKRVPFLFFIGLAISKDAGVTYKRVSRAPVLGRNCHDPYLTASPWVLLENGKWRMWYVSGTGWTLEPNAPQPKHYYHIRYAESEDGIHWRADGVVCIDYQGDEYAIARPVVYKEEGTYKMWYCHRGGAETYRAGYAESTDGISWRRMDAEAGIDVSESGWDSEMICYPCILECGENKYLLYNGNGYGETGIGLAVLTD